MLLADDLDASFELTMEPRHEFAEVSTLAGGALADLRALGMTALRWKLVKVKYERVSLHSRRRAHGF